MNAKNSRNTSSLSTPVIPPADNGSSTELRNPLLFMSPSPPSVSDLISVKDLSRRLGITEKAIRRKMEKGILIKGIHWFRPKGYRIIFSWRAIEESIRQGYRAGGRISSLPKDASDGLHYR